MKVVVFAGGFGTLLSEETGARPKPMVEIGSRPILWHIMKLYSHYGLKDFVILGGYKVEHIKNYFMSFRAANADFTIDLATGGVEWLEARHEDWRVTVLDTGLNSMTGGRLLRAREHLKDGTFCLTYGDGVSDVNIADLIDYHRASGAWCTVTAVTQPGRYGALRINPNTRFVEGFREKGVTDGGLVNGGFFVCEPDIFQVLDDDSTVFENEPMERMISAGKLNSYHHTGFWQSMDSLRDKQLLEAMWAQSPPWRIWKD
jgi:glucose-1-phosphate cytidylyltransferase